MKNRAFDPARRTAEYRGFTLIELLVVITIILIVSAVTLPTVLPALSHRQVSEGARILQAALAGARDAAIRDNSASGIRLLPDPTFPVQYTTVSLPSGGTQVQVDATQPLVYNRIIPISPAPNYTTGVVSVQEPSSAQYTTAPNLPAGATVLVLEEVASLTNEPTSWFWNLRVGDKVQLNNAGPWYTIVGPMETGPSAGNSELFVNAITYPTRPNQSGPGTVTLTWDYLYLVNGRDDFPQDGYIDNGWDGVTTTFETELWLGNYTGAGAVPITGYTVARRPVPTINAREMALPSNVVIDATTWDYPYPAAATLKTPAQYPSVERSRLPVNVFNGYVEFMVYPNGTVVPTFLYSSPSSFGLSQAFFHFWLAERADVYAPAANSLSASSPPYLPLPQSAGASLFNGAAIKGEYRLVTLFTRTGQITTNESVPFDNPSSPANATTGYNPSYPFLAAQQGAIGGQQ
jgi:prepilin-type N-terminal cleavage/methylation domain-containing protein